MRIFLAAPFTDMLNSQTGILEGPLRERIEEIIELIEYEGHSVTSCHIREQWGEKLESPAQVLNTDFEAIKHSDLIVALLNDPPSPGVQMELGFAVSFKKKIVLLKQTGMKMPYLSRGLEHVFNSVSIEYDAQNDLLSQLEAELRSNSATK